MEKYIVREFTVASFYDSKLLEAFLNDPELLDDYDLVTVICVSGFPMKAIYKLK